MTGARWLVAGGLLFAWQSLAGKERPRLPTRESWLQIVATAMLLLVFGNGLLCIAELRVESGTAALLIATTPIWMLLIEALLTHTPPKATAIGGIVLGSVGIVLLAGHGAGGANVFYAALIVLSSISWAAGSIYARGKDHGPMTAALEMIAGGALCIVAGVLTGELPHLHLAAISRESLWGMLWLITAGAMIGYSAYAYVVRTLPVATVATYGYVNPVVAVILGALILHEPITWNVAAGGAAIIASVLLILMRS